MQVNKKFLIYNLIIYFVFVLLLYFSGYFKIGFLSDDYMNFYDAGNTTIGEKLTGDLIYANKLHVRPVTSLYMQLSYQLHNLLGYSYDDFRFYKAEELLIYLAISFLSGLILFHLTKNLRLSVILSGAVLIFPNNLHSVCWTSGCVDMLCILFYLLSLYLMFLFLDNDKRIYFILSAASFFLALLSKETAVTLPFVISGFVYFNQRSKFGLLKKYLAPHFAVFIIYFTYRLIFLHNDLLSAANVYQTGFLVNFADTCAKSLISLTIPVDYLTLTLYLTSHEPLMIIYLAILYGTIIYLISILIKSNGFNHIMHIFLIGLVTLIPYIYIGYLRPQMIFLSFIIILIQLFYIYNKKIKLTLFLNKKLITVVFTAAILYWTGWSVLLVADWKDAYNGSRIYMNELLKQDFSIDKTNIIIGNKARVKQSFMFNQLTGAYNYWKYRKLTIMEKFNDLVQVGALDTSGIFAPLNYVKTGNNEYEINTTGKNQFFVMEGFDNIRIRNGFSNGQMSVEFTDYNELKKPVKMKLKLLSSDVYTYLVNGYNIIKLQ